MNVSGVVRLIRAGDVEPNGAVLGRSAGVQIGSLRVPTKENESTAITVTPCPPIGSVPIFVTAVEIQQQVVDEILDIQVFQHGLVVLANRQILASAAESTPATHR